MRSRAPTTGAGTDQVTGPGSDSSAVRGPESPASPSTDRAAPPRRHRIGEARAEWVEHVDTFALAAAGLGLAFLLAGVVWPHFSGSFLRGYLVSLVVLFVWSRVVRAELPEAKRLDSWSPFDGFTDPRASAVPDGLLDLLAELRAADDPVRSARALVPASVTRIVRSEAERLLSERLGLRLDDPDHHPAIRRRLEPRSWDLIDPARRADDPREVAISHLESILDDLETL